MRLNTILMEKKQWSCGVNGGSREQKRNGHSYSIMILRRLFIGLDGKSGRYIHFVSSAYWPRHRLGRFIFGYSFGKEKKENKRRRIHYMNDYIQTLKFFAESIAIYIICYLIAFKICSFTTKYNTSQKRYLRLM